MPTRTDETRVGAVCQTTLSNGYWISTIPLTSPFAMILDKIIGDRLADEGRADLSTPGKFETMVFACDESGEVTSWTELDFSRYESREAAIEGHEKIVEKWKAK